MHRAHGVSLLESGVALFVMLVQWRALPRFEDSYVYVCGAAELVFYAVLYFVARRAWRWLRSEFLRTSVPYWLSAAVHSSVAMGLVTLALAPWLFYGYGWEDVDLPIAVSRVSFGAMFAVSPPLLLGDAVPITYHSFVQWVILWPTLCLLASPGVFAWSFSTLGYPVVVWFASLAYYGTSGALVAMFAPAAGGTATVDGRALWRRQHWVRPMAFASHIVLIQYFLTVIPNIDPIRFTRSAVELERAPRWRYGYVRLYHDAMLVKALRTGNEPTFVSPDAADRTASRMRRELRLRPWKASLELLFYGSLFWLWYSVRPQLSRAVRANRTRRRWCMSAALVAVLSVTALMMPFLLFEYGDPLATTSVGPAVSYRLVLSAAVALPLAAMPDAFDVADDFESALAIRAALWLWVCLFWSLLATVGSCIGYRSLEADSTG